MKTWALITQKGGAGKSTLSLNLAITASAAGKQVALIDIDPQQSIYRWSRLRTSDIPVTIRGHAERLPQLLDQARDAGADLVVIDTPARSGEVALQTARCADLVIMPCNPATFDLDAVIDTDNIVKRAGSPVAVFVLNRCNASSNEASDAADALEEFGRPIAKVWVGDRIAFRRSLREGQGVVEYEPNGKAAKEIKELFEHITKIGANPS